MATTAHTNTDRRTRRPTLTMTRGLPGSGKSTWATAHVLERPAGAVIRINKDLLREMLHAGRHKGKTERQVVAARDRLVAGALSDGVDVIVDDTNCNPVHEQQLRTIAASCGAQFAVQDFTDVPLDECIRRDAGRPHPVGASVITKMHRQWLHTPPATPVANPGAPRAVICDIDGTLASMNGRSPYAWDKVSSDTPVANIVDLVRLLHDAGVVVLYVSGRDGVCFDQTRSWLDTHVQVPGELFMRAAGDTRSDAVVKRELFDAHIRGRFDVRWVLDDRDRVVRVWRDEIGLTCLQVAPGDF
jgi:predicted kinase